LDATVAAFSASAAIWYFDPETASASDVSLDDLQSSLEATLEFTPHLAGQLQWTDYDPRRGHNHRYRRLEVAYGGDQDPGVEFVIAESSLRFSEVLPSFEHQRENRGASWDCSAQPTNNLLSSTPLALSSSKTSEGCPCQTLQITTFQDGGVAVGVAFSHPIADATTLAHFVQGWASVNRAMKLGAPIPEITSIFNPQQLDSFAAGDIDAESADESITITARALPLHRYDQGLPESSKDLQPPLANLSPSTPLPRTWDQTKPISRRVLHFSQSDVDRLWLYASKATSVVYFPELTISRHDALVAHVWMLINRARKLDHDSTPVYLDYSFGFRSRIRPRLPSAFYGSPLMNAAVESRGEILCKPDALPMIARTVRNTMAKFNESTVPLLLHDAAFEASPQRLWQAYLGKHHVLLTTWVHTKAHQIDLLGTGRTPSYVEAIMPKVDGLVQIMEACPQRHLLSDSRSQESWYAHGANVMINITEEAMERMLVDPLLMGPDETP